ncbi:MAG: TPM domain-containing protein [Parcubacteria group bacterium]|nr:TPM domain-containing protein [Parcubacteria group bacterium]
MKKIFFIILIFVFYPALSEAQVSYPEKKQEYVNDFTDVLGDTSSLEEEIEKFEKDTSNRINIAVLNTLDDASIDEYASRLYEKWRIGKDKDNGILVLVCLQDKKIYIKVGYGLSNSISPEINQTIIDNEISPSFQEGMYLEGLEKGNKAIMAATLGEYKVDSGNNYSSIVFVVILISVFIFLFIFSNIKAKKKRTRNNLKKIRNI